MKVGQRFKPYRMFTGIFIPDAIARCRQLSPGAKLASGRLVRYEGERREAFPSLGTLADEMGVGRSSAALYQRRLLGKWTQAVSRYQ
jgi:hypothetical protein